MTYTVKSAWQEVGGLSKPSKMPCYGYSLSAFMCIVGSKLRDILNSTCSDCYALKGRYVFPNVQKALDLRLAQMLFNPNWTSAMSFLVSHYGKKSGAFRWHDSGDLQSLNHLEKIATVATATPDVDHWLPSREVGIIKEYLKKHKTFPTNLVVRISATMIDGNPHKFHAHTSTVASIKDKAIDWLCPAPTQGNKCQDCRACWSKEVSNVTYLAH